TPTYRMTMVDRAGRTYTFLVAPGVEAAQFDRLFRVFELSRDNPQLRIIVRQMVMPMLGRLYRDAQAEVAPPRRRSPSPRRVKPPVPKAK
ncbi:hypothetical protein HQ576_10770, partial [bacterium]|nr:hypothetical protein [bacterium]